MWINGSLNFINKTCHLMNKASTFNAMSTLESWFSSTSVNPSRASHSSSLVKKSEYSLPWECLLKIQIPEPDLRSTEWEFLGWSLRTCMNENFSKNFCTENLRISRRQYDPCCSSIRCVYVAKLTVSLVKKNCICFYPPAKFVPNIFSKRKDSIIFSSVLQSSKNIYCFE